MMASTPEIWLGDLIRAVAAIPGDAEVRQDIAALLGLAAPRIDPASGVRRDPPREEAAGQVTVGRGESPAEETGAGQEAADPPPDDSIPMLPETGREPVDAGDWASTPSLPEVTDELLAARPEMSPLLPPRSTAAVLNAMLATQVGDGPVDVRSLTETLARGRPIPELPREPALTLRYGVQVLLDIGEAMELFTRDQDELIPRIEGLIGTKNTTTMLFEDSPARGAGPGPRRTWRPYRPPGPGCRVLIVSDFGLGGPAFHVGRSRPEEWTRFVAQLRRAGCPVAGLVPYPPSRWPGWLTALMPLVFWDRTTTAVKAAIHAADRTGTTPGRSGQPGHPVEELASVLSAAVRIEAELIRAVRLEVFPSLDVAVEADLWFGDLVVSRGAQGIAFESEKRDQLRAALSMRLAEAVPTDPIRKAGAVIARVHAQLSPALVLEERVTWLALCGDVAEIDDALRPALKAVASEGREGVARWFASAWSRLPEAVRTSLTAWKLAQLSPPGLTARSISRSGVGPVDLADIVDSLADVRLLVRRDGQDLEVGDLEPATGAAGVEVPDTDPRLLDVLDVPSAGTQPVVVRPGEVARLYVGRDVIRLRNARGSIFELAPPRSRPGQEAGRFVGVCVAEYDHDYAPLPQSVADMNLLASVLARDFSVQSLTNPTEAMARDVLSRLRGSMPGGGPLVVVWSGHASMSAGRLRLTTRDSDHEANLGIAVDDLAEACAASGATQILLVVDTCYSGAALDSVTRIASDAMPQGSPEDGDRWFGVLAASRGDERARESLLLRTMSDLLTEGPRRADLNLRWSPHNRFIRGDDFCDAVIRTWDSSSFQSPGFTARGVAGWMFPNPRWVPGLPKQVLDHLLLAARGGAGPDERSRFTGRAAEVGQVVDWLQSGQPGLFLVTGSPGTGKSAIAGRVATLSDPTERQRLLAEASALGHPDPGERSVAAHVYARDLTADGVADAIASQLVGAGVLPPQADRRNAAELVGQLQRARENDARPPVIIIDGLDEAAEDAFIVADDLVRRLARYAAVIVTTREIRRDGSPWSLMATLSGGAAVLDLDDPAVRVRGLADIRAYLAARLTGVSPRMDAAVVADYIAGQWGAAGTTPFALAQLVADGLRAAPVDTSVGDWPDTLPATMADAFDAELDGVPSPAHRPVPEGWTAASMARVMLTALTWAQGAGFPAGEWVACANGIAPAGGEFETGDVGWVFGEFGAHVTRGRDGDGADCYRLADEVVRRHLRPPYQPGPEQPFDPQASPVAAALTSRYRSRLGSGELIGPAGYLPRHLWWHAAEAGPGGLGPLDEIAESVPALRPDVGKAARHVAARLRAVRRPGDAQAHDRTATDVYLRLAEDDPRGSAPALAEALDDLSRDYREAGDVAAAEAVWREATDGVSRTTGAYLLTARATAAGPGHPDAVDWLVIALRLADGDPDVVSSIRADTRRIRGTDPAWFDDAWRRTGQTSLPSWLAGTAAPASGGSTRTAHLVVVVPGFMGSNLRRDGKTLWSLSSIRSAARLTATLGRSVLSLQLPEGIGDDHPDDGVEPAGLAGDLTLIPGLARVRAYDRLLDRLRRLGYQEAPGGPDGPPGNLVPLAYDWRLSHRWTGRWIGTVVEPALERWRAQGGAAADAKVVFICCATGGLAARWYIERCGGGEITARVITIGTPYRGMPTALSQLVNGIRPGIGAASIDLSAFVRSLPAMYQMLPHYACVETAEGLAKITEVSVPTLDSARIADAMAFHDDLLGAERARPESLDATTCIVGVRQSTTTTVRLDDGVVVPIQTYQGEDLGGDGTVPVFSASRPDIPMDSPVVRRFAEKHSELYGNTQILYEIEGILTGQSIIVR